jgi:hypothetical protein
MSSYLKIARQAVKREERHKMDKDYTHKDGHPSPVARREQSLNYELRETYEEKPDTLSSERDKSDESDQSSSVGVDPWNEEIAYKLIRDALAYLNERYLEYGKPDYNGAALDEAHDRIEEAYEAEDMGELHLAVRSFVVAGLKEFRRWKIA